MRVLGMMFVMIFLGLGPAFAATVNLTDGSSVQGNIIKQDNKSLQISVDGVAMTYYADEIKDIDGQPLAAGQIKPAAPSADQGTGNMAIAPEPTAPPEAAAVAPSAVAPVSQPEAAVAQPATTPAPTGLPGAMDEDKRALILKFIDVFGTRQALINNFESMLQQIEKEKPDEAQKIRQRVKVDEIIERLLPIYDRNFTSEDLKAFIAFYGSAEGQKLIGTIPELMKESVQESVKYMEEKFPEVKQGQ